ncbi:HEAT repeat domain-containing protein [Streptomyces sp. NBC_01476]|uniref:HEAT repeat domain-containing protein n=1 Tax=Streptomyces sp. NBC_01476 TaxID=2903881 RepID=UPI002E37F8B9|nr:HEAT repeat domain-containing protein [Streptomyces sp. NBC_01476]
MTTWNDDDKHHSRTVDRTLPDPRDVIVDTDWAALHHAYGPAEDTPSSLLRLLDDSPEVQAEALGALDMSVLHQGSLYSATPPAALFIAGILSDPRTTARHESFYPWDDRTRALRAALLEFLGQVADAAAYGETDGDDHARKVQDDADTDVTACRAIRPALYAAVSAFIDDPDPDVREAAVGAAGALLKAPNLADQVPDAVRHFRRVLATRTDRRERAAAVLSISVCHQDTADLLTDEDPAIRACAALSPANAGNGEATEILLRALLEPAVADAWFPEPLPQFDGWFRFTLLAAAIERTESFDALLPAALALLTMADEYTVDNDWGPLLAKAFPHGFTSAMALTASQRDFLEAVVGKDDCWGNIANRDRWLHGAGLPHRRAELRAILGRVPSDGAQGVGTGSDDGCHSRLSSP